MALGLNKRFSPARGKGVLFAVAITVSGFVSTLEAEDGALEAAGLTEIDDGEGGGKNWALLIGINYAGRQDEDEIRSDPRNRRALPELKNATNDAKDLKSVLITYYHYDPSRVVLLTDDGENVPTQQRIRDEITNLHTKVGEEDSLLVFFAGHGFKQPLNQSVGGKNVLLLPYDVKLHEGRPVAASTIGLPDEFTELLRESPARHKLVILDCCYSGEIFNARGSVGFQSQSLSANRGDEALQREPSFQAIASSRATQVASDGRDGNSKFTTALLDGLKHLPARREGEGVRRVWANRLLAYMSPHFDESQRPDCRSLVGFSGEFCLYPQEAEKFKEYILDPNELIQLRAMVVSRQGNWWFHEMPWFFPAIRAQIIIDYEKQKPTNRSTDFVDLIDFDELKEVANKTIERHKGNVQGIKGRRFEHAEMLLAASTPKKLREAMEVIEQELSKLADTSVDVATSKSTARSTTTSASVGEGATPRLPDAPSPEDLHFLAVLQHAMGKPEARDSYAQALKAYRDAPKEKEILSSLCTADHGVFLLTELREPKLAADEFKAARLAISPPVPIEKRTAQLNRQELSSAYFKIFMLCQEADACLRINHWTRANRLLADAVEVATTSATGHFLEAHVHRRRAWAEIIQWHIQEAKCSFERSNQILHAQFLREARERGDLVGDDIRAATPVAESANVPPTLPAGDSDCLLETRFQPLGAIFHKSQDDASKVAYLHNLHGIAMATRFQGNTVGAARYYRALDREVQKSLYQFWSSSADKDIEQQFVTRIINTRERLGDCNLFGDPDERDLAEAFDDYRRALSFVHFRDSDARARTDASLLYKQALALSLPSPVQDTELALEFCRRADKVYQPECEKAGGLWQALGELTTKTVQLLDDSASLPRREALKRESAPADELRRAILAYRDEIGRTPHRDQLELCLFASNALLMHAGEQSKYQLSADADLLLSFCRLALSSDDQTQVRADVVTSESRNYLRPYFDSVMRAKLRNASPRMKELVEIQAEATLGTRYLKSNLSLPTLAMYTLGDACYLILDLPHDQGKCVDLSSTYDMRAIHRATQSSEQRLPLPRELHQMLSDWNVRMAGASRIAIDLRWQDPVNDSLTVLPLPVNSTDPDRVVVNKQSIGHFPFTLPSGFSPLPLDLDDVDVPSSSARD